jgi:hypothetical protein
MAGDGAGDGAGDSAEGGFIVAVCRRTISPANAK